ncbi:hypothetical protein [Vibrio hyugaensis]|uniref:Uncharacterized protein n=1 Tax=Vibrio hyugaensis TaxID=1534743 RepID=A0ABQ5Y5W4_9VIBR|nr:hypothetical protein [Vibrio hyugaensis]GLR06333.1 hypothetical protein GCM10007906_39210 [Vibrio hyugaensis]
MNIEYKKLKWHAVLKLSQQTIKYLEEENNTNFSDIDKVRANVHAAELLQQLLSDLAIVDSKSGTTINSVKRA